MMRMDVAYGRDVNRADPPGRRFAIRTVPRAIAPIAKTCLAATGMEFKHRFMQRRRAPWAL
jgi:hypothetical protein